MRKTIFFLFLAISFHQYANAQDDIERSGKWQLSAFYAPELGYRTLYSEDSNFNKYVVTFREKLEKPAMGYCTGAGIKFKLGKHWALNSGLAFTERTYKWPKMSIATATSEYHILVVVKHASTTDIALKTRYGYFSIPLTVEYGWQLKKLSLGFFAGGTADCFLYFKERTSEFDKENNEMTEVLNRSKSQRKYKTGPGYKPIVGNVLGGLSFSMPIKDRIGVAISPYTKWSTATIKNPRLTERLYSYGLNFAVTYDL